jgi:acyl-CoA thioesterase FadM
VARGGEELAEGETTQMLIDKAGKPRSFPEAIAKRFDGNL